MAKGRRPPDFRATLGSLVQSALEQVGVVREVVERGAQQQRQRLDTVKLERRRRDALMGLGEAVYRLAVRDRLGPLADDPEIRAQLEEIDDVDQRIEAAEQTTETGFAASSGYPRPAPARRPSGQGRRTAARQDDGGVRVWRPVPPFTAPDAADDAVSAFPAHRDDDLDDDVRPRGPTGGGIQFGDASWDDDDDLEEYMHDDDVPVPPPAAAAPEPEPEPEAAKPKPRKRRRKRVKTKGDGA